MHLESPQLRWHEIETAAEPQQADDTRAQYLLWLVFGLVSASIAGPLVLLYALSAA